jgi:hypothetical protein
MVGFSYSPNSFAAVIVLLSSHRCGVIVNVRYVRIRSRLEQFWSRSRSFLLIVLLGTHSRTAVGTLIIASEFWHCWTAKRAAMAYAIRAGIERRRLCPARHRALVMAMAFRHGSLPQAQLELPLGYRVAARAW